MDQELAKLYKKSGERGQSANAPDSTRASRLDREVEQLRHTRAHLPHALPNTSQTPAHMLTTSSGASLMAIFSRARDIIAANFTELLNQSDDPTKMIRMIILEMEETLVEVRASAARTIADQKEMLRHQNKLHKLMADWDEKARFALSKGREDLARAALQEKRKAGDIARQLEQEITVLDDAMRAYEQDIAKLQNRLREARSRQTQIAARLESAENRIKLRSLMTSERVDEALARFDELERRADYAEGRAEALHITGHDRSAANQLSLSDQISALEGSDSIEAELAEMKRAATGNKNNASQGLLSSHSATSGKPGSSPGGPDKEK